MSVNETWVTGFNGQNTRFLLEMGLGGEGGIVDSTIEEKIKYHKPAPQKYSA